MEEVSFYSEVDASSEYRTFSIMCIPIYSTSHLARIAPHDPDKHEHHRSYNRTAKSSALSVVGVIELINKRNNFSHTKNTANTDTNAFIPFTEQDCIKACCMVNASNVTSTIKEMFDQELTYASSLNAAVEDALRLDVPWARVTSKLVPIQKMLKNMRLDVAQQQDMRDPAYEPGYHYDRWGLTNRMAENCLEMDFSSFKNPGKVVRLLQSSSVACVNIRANNGETPLMKAVICRRDGLVTELLSSGADPYYTDTRGNTVLHLAAMSHNSIILHLLITAVCDPFALNGAGHTPRALCESKLKMAICADGHDQVHEHAVAYLRNVGEKKNHTDNKEVDMLAIDRLQTLLSESNLKTCMFPNPQVGRELVDLMHTLRDALSCRKMLLAAEAVWLRVFDRGFSNVWVNSTPPLPPSATNVVHRVVTAPGEWSEPTYFIGWDINESMVPGAPAINTFEVTASPALPKAMSIVIERSASSDVARSQRIQREFGIRITGMADRVKYKFKVTVVSSAGCSPASSWSIAMKRRSVKEEKVSAAALNHDDNPWSEQQKCMYWEGLLSLPELQSRINQPTDTRTAAEIAEQKSARNYRQHDTLRHEIFESCLARGSKLRHLISLRKRSDREKSLRRSGKTLMYWSMRNFAPCDDVDMDASKRFIESANTTNMKAAVDLSSSFNGLEKCTFNVQCTADISQTDADVKREQYTPLKVARGNAGCSFVFTYDGSQPSKIQKSKSRSHLSIKITAFGLKGSDKHTFTFPIRSSSVVVTRGRLAFGNAVVTVFCPPSVFSLANVNYYICIPKGAFQCGVDSPSSIWYDSPEIIRCVRTNNSQVLWDRSMKCPLISRKLIWREIQLAHTSINGSTKVFAGKKPDLGKRPVMMMTTLAKTLFPHVAKINLDDNLDEELLIKKRSMCLICEHHSETNYFDKKTTNGYVTQCWHAAQERCEVCGHEWSEERDLKARQKENEKERAERRQSEIAFISSPSNVQTHFFVKDSKALRFLPYLNDLQNKEEGKDTRNPELFTREMILGSVLTYFSTDATGPFLGKKQTNKTWSDREEEEEHDEHEDDDEEEEDAQKVETNYRFVPTRYVSDNSKYAIAGDNPVCPQTNHTRQQILKMVSNLEESF